MRAAIYEDFGTARDVLKVVEVDTPAPGEGEVRVRLATSGVNPSDVKQRGAVVRRPIAFPVTPHSDGAGVIDAVGAGVDEARIGERVWVWNAQFRRSGGTAADYVVLPQAQAVRLADHTGFDAGACFGIPALTAWRAVTLFGPVEGLSVLVQGGAGAVGHYAIQVAKAMGATVIATVSSDAKAAHARAAGADHIVNYCAETVAERVKELTGGSGVDRLIEVEFADNAATYPGLLAQGAKVAVYGATRETTTFPSQPWLALQPTFQFFNVYMMPPGPRAEAVAWLTGMCEQGKLQHSIAARFPLEKIVEAHEAVESGAPIGNVIVDIADLG